LPHLTLEYVLPTVCEVQIHGLSPSQHIAANSLVYSSGAPSVPGGTAATAPGPRPDAPWLTIHANE